MDMGVRPDLSPQFGKKQTYLLSPQFGKKQTYLLATCNNLIKKKEKEMSNAQDFSKY